MSKIKQILSTATQYDWIAGCRAIDAAFYKNSNLLNFQDLLGRNSVVDVNRLNIILLPWIK